MRLDFHLMGYRDMGDVDDDFFLSRATYSKAKEIMKICNFFNKINADICDGVSVKMSLTRFSSSS